jgi:hypothetical protein
MWSAKRPDGKVKSTLYLKVVCLIFVVIACSLLQLLVIRHCLTLATTSYVDTCFISPVQDGNNV